MIMTGAEILIEALKREGVEVIFGIPGGAVIDIYDCIYKKGFRHILTRHEQAAVHAADGYARASGKVGVCIVTSGPGATNTVTGIATSFMDSVPIVVFTGQIPTPLIGNDAFQEADIVGITRPCTKHSYLVKDVKELAYTIKEAFYIAKTGRPGPVLVDLPKDVMGADTEFDYPEKISLRSYNPTYNGHIGQIKRALELILNSKNPVIYAGGGVVISEASFELITFAKKFCIPVTTTLMGLGVYPEDDDLSLGMLGMHGTYRANMAVSHCDLLIAIGARFDDRVTGKVSEFAPFAQIIHIDIDPTSISKNVKVNIPIVGDAKRVLSKMLELTKEVKEDFCEKRKPWLSQIEEWKRTYPLAYKQNGDKIKPQFVIEKINEITKGEAIICTEVGQNQMWTAQYYCFKKPRRFLSSGGLGTMGYGLPAAIGAQVAFPDMLVIDIAGDGSIQMNIQELATLSQYNLPVKIVILNNGYLGMVRQWQELFYGRRYSQTKFEFLPDFVKLAEAYGALGLEAKRSEEVEEVLKKGFSAKRPVVMNFFIDPEENVYPMVPAGESIRNMLLV